MAVGVFLFLMNREEEDLLLLLLVGDEKPKQRSVWVRDILLRRDERGEFSSLFSEERCSPAAFQESYRMSPATFDELLDRLKTRIERQDIGFRPAIPAAERLAVTIR